MQERTFCERLKDNHIAAITRTYEDIRSNPITALTTTGVSAITSATFLTTPQNSCNMSDNCTVGTLLVGAGGAGATAILITGMLYAKNFIKEVRRPTSIGINI